MFATFFRVARKYIQVRNKVEDAIKDGAKYVGRKVIAGTTAISGKVVGGKQGLAKDVVKATAGMDAATKQKVAARAAGSVGGAQVAMQPFTLLGSMHGQGAEGCLKIANRNAQPGLAPDRAFGGEAQLANMQAATIYTLQMTAMARR